MEYLRPLRDLNRYDVAIAGGKGASLGEMVGVGIKVPDGFVVLTNAFDEFLKETDLNIEIDSILHEIDLEAVHTIEAASAKIQRLIKEAKVPMEVVTEVTSDFADLGAEFVAVRSSATTEDSESAAWAGQLDTFLNVTEENLLVKLQACWASLFTPRALFYRGEHHLLDTHVSVAVIVQKMIDSEKSGIAFSVHPVTEDLNQLIIEAGFGLGEAIVSGAITPDSYVVEKEPRRIIDRNINTQTRGLFQKEGGGSEWRQLGAKGAELVLSDADVLALSEQILKIEQHFSFPCDIEWAYADGEFHITQSRPITTLKKEKFETQKSIFEKAYTRDIALAVAQAGLTGYSDDATEEVNPYGDPMLLYLHEGVVEVWLNYRSLDWFNQKLKQRCVDTDYVKQLITSYEAKQRAIETCLAETRDDIAQLKKLLELFAAYRLENHIMFTAASEPGWPEEITNWAKQAREKDFLWDKLDAKARSILRNRHPEIAGVENALVRSEISAPPTRAELEARQQHVVLTTPEIITVASLKSYVAAQQKYHFEFEGDTKLPGRVLHGESASRGKGCGKVQIIRRKDQVATFETGNVLVASMTTPDFVPAMRRAAAIVTDEGGVMSHAAILSREFGIPCVAGTKIATQVLKDGDEVEVNAEAGEVRKL